MIPLFRPLLSLACVSILLFVNPASSVADVVLTVVKGQNQIIDYTLDDLQSLSDTQIVTENDFVDGTAVFSGPLVRDVLNGLDEVASNSVTFYAANDYFVEIAVDEFETYDVIMAIRMDGEFLSRRDKGPIWIIYPMSDHEELQDAQYNNRLIWQVVKMELN